MAEDIKTLVEEPVKGHVISWKKALEQTMDDEEFLNELLVEMQKEIQGALESLHKSVGADDTKQIQYHAHAIKGTAANLYVERVSDVAQKLEHMAKGRKMLTDPYFTSHAESLLAVLDKEVDAFFAVLKERGL